MTTKDPTSNDYLAHVRIDRRNPLDVIDRPAHQLARQVGEMISAVEPKGLNRFVPLAALEIDNDAAVRQRVEQFPDRRDSDGCVGVEGARLMIVADIARVCPPRR